MYAYLEDDTANAFPIHSNIKETLHHHFGSRQKRTVLFHRLLL